MKRRFTGVILLAFVSALPLAVEASPSAASANWSQWGARCARWIADIPKVDSNIIKYENAGNVRAMAFQIIALAADGRQIRACNSSPDQKLNSDLHGWGSSLITVGIVGYNWANSGKSTGLPRFLSAESVAKTWETRVENRLTALGL
jgi:hypothetical protein